MTQPLREGGNAAGQETPSKLDSSDENCTTQVGWQCDSAVEWRDHRRCPCFRTLAGPRSPLCHRRQQLKDFYQKLCNHFPLSNGIKHLCTPAEGDTWTQAREPTAPMAMKPLGQPPSKPSAGSGWGGASHGLGAEIWGAQAPGEEIEGRRQGLLGLKGGEVIASWI